MIYLKSLFLLLPAVLASQQPLGPVHATDADGFTIYQSTTSPHHAVRVKRQNDTICDARSAQYTGWLDVGRKHMFFWYFESLHNPTTDPLTLWLTGGPGGSSMLGLFQELGPCLITCNSSSPSTSSSHSVTSSSPSCSTSDLTTRHNPSTWTHATNLLFLDQPAGVGFSYLDKGEPLPGDSYTAAQDAHAFLQIFTHQVFPSLKHRAVHLSGESYAGHYVPVLGQTVLQQNALYPSAPQVNLQSIFVGNAAVSLFDVAWGYWSTLCTTQVGMRGPVFNATRCDAIAEAMPRCMKVKETCYERPDPAVCEAAAAVCWEGVVSWYDGESYKGGRNRFDISKPCVDDDEMCYIESRWIQEYLNTPPLRRALAVPSSIKNYSVISPSIFDAFTRSNDEGFSTIPQVRHLLEHEIDVLFYNGNLDIACNTAGNLRLFDNMPWKGWTEFAGKRMGPWTSSARSKGRGRAQGLGEVVDIARHGQETVGTYKEVKKIMREGSEKETKFAFVTIDLSGHLVPQDQPEVALDMVQRWLGKKSFGYEREEVPEEL